jgi:hypothetical protein
VALTKTVAWVDSCAAMSAQKNRGSVQAELLKLTERLDLLEELCGDDLNEEAVRAVTKDIRKHIDRIAKLIDME